MQGHDYVFLFVLQNFNCWYSLEPPQRVCFEQKEEKCQTFCAENSRFLQLRKNLYIT